MRVNAHLLPASKSVEQCSNTKILLVLYVFKMLHLQILQDMRLKEDILNSYREMKSCFSPIAWKSMNIKRVLKSTLAVETLVLDHVLETF